MAPQAIEKMESATGNGAPRNGAGEAHARDAKCDRITDQMRPHLPEIGAHQSKAVKREAALNAKAPKLRARGGSRAPRAEFGVISR